MDVAPWGVRVKPCMGPLVTPVWVVCLIKASDKSRQHGHCDGRRELKISQDPAASHTVVLASYLSAIPKHWWKGAGLISFQLTFAFICVCSVKVVLACS